MEDSGRRIFFTAQELTSLRRTIERGISCKRNKFSAEAKGWFHFSKNAISIEGGLQHIHIRDGYELRAYQYVDGGNGNAFVFAQPVNAPVPDPNECMKRVDGKNGVVFDVPTPPDALPSFMDAIEGVYTPDAYAEASILFRALNELGAMWHGCGWTDEVIIDAHPNDFKFDKKCSHGGTNTQRDQWNWKEPEPDDWRGISCLNGDMTAYMAFYTWSPLMPESICKMTDSYAAGSFLPQTCHECMATGNGGILY